MEDLNRDQLVYLAGIVDGEGCIHGGISSGRPQVWIRVSMTHPYAPTLLYTLFKGHLNESTIPSGKLMYAWVAGGCTAGKAVEALLPWLVVKKKQAELLKLFVSTIGAGGQDLSDKDQVIRFKVIELLYTLNSGRDHCQPREEK